MDNNNELTSSIHHYKGLKYAFDNFSNSVTNGEIKQRPPAVGGERG